MRSLSKYMAPAASAPPELVVVTRGSWRQLGEDFDLSTASTGLLHTEQRGERTKRLTDQTVRKISAT